MSLSEKFKNEFTKAIKDNAEPCWRCGKLQHGTKRCTTDLAECYERGPVYTRVLAPNFKKVDDHEALRLAAEVFWNTEVNGGSKDSFGERKPIPDSKIGTILYTPNAAKSQPPPNVSEHGFANIPTEHIGSQPTASESLVISNCVKVTSVPKVLYVYSLSFSRRKAKDKQVPMVYNKRRELKRAFQSLIDAEFLDLDADGQAWATDFKDLWTHKPLTGHVDNGDWDAGPSEYKQLNGKKINELWVTIHHTGTLEGIDKALADDDIGELSEHIRALNAHVAQSVRQQKKAEAEKTIQVGANKFYIKDRFQDMGTTTRGTTSSTGLRAMPGYYTSVRPTTQGTMLNINTATGAFITPMLVPDLLDCVKNEHYVDSILRGATLRTTYHRKNFEQTQAEGVDFNGDLERRKTFTQFGLTADLQKFFKVIEKKRNDPKSERTTDPKDKGRTVMDFFNSPKDVNIQPKFKDKTPRNKWLCVNVGNRVRFTHESKPSDEKMRQQSLGGAQWIPACLLEIFPNQQTAAPLSAEHTSSMLKAAVRLPAANAGLIDVEGLSTLGFRSAAQEGPRKKLGAAGLTIGSKLISFAARTLPLPELVYGPPLEPKSMKRNPGVSENPVIRRPHLDQANWNLENIGFTSPADDAAKGVTVHVLGLSGCFEALEPKPGSKAKHENYEEVPQDIGTAKRLDHCAEDFANQLRGHRFTTWEGERLGQSIKNLPAQLKAWFEESYNAEAALILLEEKSYSLYATIKRYTDMEVGCVTVCAVGSKITDRQSGMEASRKGSRYQVLSNLALKLNMKMGGDNHWLQNNDLDRVLGVDGRRYTTMICGADVTHPGAGSKLGCPSIACVVGSVDERFMNYPGSMRLQAGRQEHIEDLRAMMRERLRAWSAKNTGALPAIILFYRDGIEGAFEDIVKELGVELKPSKKKGKGKSNKGKEPATAPALSLTLVVVGKRHNTRFYAANEKSSYKSRRNKETITNGNLKPGLLVDDIVTNPSPRNFFLQSHCAIQGTARAAHYHVLKDDMQLNTQLPNLTHMLCFAFGRATTAVSYVAPAYIADRLCEQGRAYLRPWAEGPDEKPVFEMPKDDQGRPFSKEAFQAWKKDKALQLARTKDVWGKNSADHESLAESEKRFNPWHPNLDKGMSGCERGRE